MIAAILAQGFRANCESMELGSDESSEGCASPRGGSLTPGESIAESGEGAPAYPQESPGQDSSDADMDDIPNEEGGMQCSSESGPGSDGAELESVGMELDEGSGAAGMVERGCRWQPGRDCGEFGSTSSFSLPLVQFVLTNIYFNLRRLPPALCKNILSRLRPEAFLPTRNFADFSAS